MRWRSTLSALAVMGVCVCAWGVDTPATAPPPAPTSVTTKDAIRTEEGLVYLWRRTPAVESDFGLPFPPGITATESFVYRVRDRKERDLRRYARTVFTLKDSLKDTVAVYLKALAPDAKRGTDKDTGATVLTDGAEDDTRIVTILAQGTGCRLTLEHAQRFSIPPRVYTPEEQRALKVLADVAQSYTSATSVSYKVEEAVQNPTATPPATAGDALKWSVDFTRPETLSATAVTATGTRVKIITKDKAVKVTRDTGDEETRPIEDHLTLDLVPELHDDPVARLMLGDDLSRQADYIALDEIPGVNSGDQQLLVLTYPDKDTALYLTIDLQKKTLLKADTRVVLGDQKAHILRTYSDVALITAPAPTVGMTASGTATGAQ